MTSSIVVHVPFVVVQRKVFAPTPKAVRPDVADPGDVIVPAPLTKVQLPVPTNGTLPASVAVVAQTV